MVANLFDFDTVVIVFIIVVVAVFAAARVGHRNTNDHEDY